MHWQPYHRVGECTTALRERFPKAGYSRLGRRHPAACGYSDFRLRSAVGAIPAASIRWLTGLHNFIVLFSLHTVPRIWINNDNTNNSYNNISSFLRTFKSFYLVTTTVGLRSDATAGRQQPSVPTRRCGQVWPCEICNECFMQWHVAFIELRLA